MKENSKRFLEILFNEGEHVYSAPFDYTSKRAEDGVGWEFHWPSRPVEEVDMENTTLISINPLKGDVRNDDNVTAYRTFMVELDEGPLAEQKAYIETSGLPYSLCVFSGGKSLHYAITLSEDLPSYDIWHLYAEWILNTLPKADKNTKNPSRGIRFPEVQRKGKKMQKLVEARGRISLNKLDAYLSQHPDKKPKPEKYEEFEFKRNHHAALAKWVLKGLKSGNFDMNKGRNATWFALGYEFAKCGYSKENTFEILEKYYSPEPTFKQAEWTACINNGYRTAAKKYWRSV